MVFLILSPKFLIASDDKNKCHKSTEGTEFWFGFMESRNYSGLHYVEITVTARETTNFTITIGPNETPFNGTYTVSGNNSLQIRIPWQSVEATGSETAQDKAVHLVADNLVNVYALNYDRNSADVAVIYPVESLGTSYFAMCYTPNVAEYADGSYKDGRNSEFMIAATADSTAVKIKPKAVTDKLKPADSTFTVYLNKGQLYQVQSMNHKNMVGQGDLTGSYISSDKPIAFYSGSLSTTVPYSSTMCCWDHLYEQIPPVHSWGRDFYAVPLKSREQDRYRILASEDNTTVVIDQMATVHLNKGQYYEFVLHYLEAKHIYADKSILVAQFSQSQRVDENFTGGNGDPFMIILSPVSQAKNDVTFVAYQSSEIVNYFINIIAPTSETGKIELDGSTRQNLFNAYPGSKFSYAQIPTSPGTHRLYDSNPDMGFIAYVYGFGGVESYGYGVGFNLNLVLDLGKSLDLAGDTLTLCKGDSIKLDAGPYFDTYLWNTGDTTQTLNVTKENKYWAATTTYDGCSLYDSIYIKLSAPETSIGADIDTCPPYSRLLDAGIFNSYSWNTGDTSQTISVNKTGLYSVDVTNQFGCHARDTMKMKIFEVPDIALLGDTLICGKRSTTIHADLSGVDPSLWNYKGGLIWSSGNPNLKFSKTDSTSTEITVADWGEYKIRFKVKTVNGCQNSVEKIFRFYQIPTSKLDFTDDPGDKCKGYNRQVAYTGNATTAAQFYWDFGGCKVLDTLSWQKYNVSVGAFNSSPHASLYVEENGCKSDTSRLFIGASPDFKLETLKSRGCDTATIYFRGTLGIADSLLFEWDFGDGTPINHQQNPINFYKDTGSYDVGLTITNLLSGCRIGYTMDDFVKIFKTPTADFGVDQAFCYPDSFKAIYSHAIDSSICTWVYTGSHVLRNFNDSAWIKIDSSVAKLTLNVDEYGCLSQPVSKSIKRKPHFDIYTEDDEGCQGRILETIAIPYDSLLLFTWLHDSLPNVTSKTDYYVFNQPGKFSVGLVALSQETQCLDTLIKKNWIWVHPKPVAGFEVDYPVATDKHPTITFTNKSSPGLAFLWDFGDGSNSKTESPSHTYTKTGDYLAQLFAESEYGCLDTAGFLVKIIPFEIFTPNAFRPSSDIPENRYFMPAGTGVDPEKFNIRIYNRWGNMIFESNNTNHKWDGKTRNGNDAPMGTYLWIAEFYDLQGFGHTQNGEVLLIR
jgi:gliding motility-associated-like protein